MAIIVEFREVIKQIIDTERMFRGDAAELLSTSPPNIEISEIDIINQNYNESLALSMPESSENTESSSVEREFARISPLSSLSDNDFENSIGSSGLSGELSDLSELSSSSEDEHEMKIRAEMRASILASFREERKENSGEEDEHPADYSPGPTQASNESSQKQGRMFSSLVTQIDSDTDEESWSEDSEDSEDSEESEDESDEDYLIVFEREEIGSLKQSEKFSSLSLSLQIQNRNQQQQKKSQNVMHQTMAGFDLLVYLHAVAEPKVDGKCKSITINVDPLLKVDQVISQIVSEEQTRDYFLLTDPFAYILNMVEDNGDIDDDLPSLGRNREIGRFHINEVGFCQNPSYSIENTRVIKISIHEGSKSKQRVSNTMVVRDLLNTLCLRRKLNTQDQVLVRLDTGEELDLNSNIADLPHECDELSLQPSRAIRELERMKKMGHLTAFSSVAMHTSTDQLEDDDDRFVVFSSNTAAQYQEYLVKLMKKGNTQEHNCVLAVDRNSVSFRRVKKKGSGKGGLISSKVMSKRNSLAFNEIVSANVSKENGFFLGYRKPKADSNKVFFYRYVTRTRGEAIEIVEKINFLKQMSDYKF